MLLGNFETDKKRLSLAPLEFMTESRNKTLQTPAFNKSKGSSNESLNQVNDYVPAFTTEQS